MHLLLVYTVFCGITAILWVFAKGSLSFIFEFPLLSLIQLCGLFAVSLLSLNFLLASRFKVLEGLLGGLDKVYKQHRLTGELAFILMIAHPTLLLVSALGSPVLLRLYTISLSDSAITFGKLAFLGFSAIILITLFAKIPYHIWRRIHQLMVVPLFFVALHVLTIKSDVAYYMPLRYWLVTLLAVSGVIYVYKVMLYKYLGPKFKYKISKISIKGEIVELTLAPRAQKIQYEPGQFVFTIFENSKIGAEEHPFSISSSPSSTDVRLSIKKSGDFTEKLGSLKVGEGVSLFGPYGQFGKRALSSDKDLVFIAGGIGVTPFLGITNYFSDQKIAKKYDMYYVVKEDREAVYKDELNKNVNSGKLYTHISNENGRITAESVAKKTKNLTSKLIFLCGPKTMMKALTEQFLALGVKRQNIIFEDFDLKG